MKNEIFSLLLVYGEVPESKEDDYQSGDYEIMISKVLPILRKIFDFEEVITLLSKKKFLKIFFNSHEHNNPIERNLHKRIKILQILQNN